jgi:hypothetical protein
MRKKHRHEAGSALILVIGVIAALAILSASLVILVLNGQSNTSRDRTQKQAFSLAEAGVDAAMAQLATSWPKASDATFDQTYIQTYLDSLTAAGYGSRTITVNFFDDLYPGDQKVVTGVHRDLNGNRQLWVEATGQVGSRSVRVRVRVKEEPQTIGLLDNIAVWTPGQYNQGSYAASVSYEVLGPGATQAVVQYGTDVSNHALDSTVQGLTPPSPADLVIPPDMVTYFKELATARDQVGVAKRYTDVTQIGISSSPATNWEGVVYVDSGTTPSQLTAMQNIAWSNKGDINGDGVGTHKQPGVLIVDAQLLKITGNNTQYYGLVYCTGAVEIQGGMSIHGLVLAGGQGLSAGTDAVKLTGNQQILYNDNVRANLGRNYSISVRMMAGTWRELQPL